MVEFSFSSMLMILTFIIGYFFITIEHYTKINKATVALMMAIVCWVIQFSTMEGLTGNRTEELTHLIGNVSQIVFFLLGALIIVEIINQHKGFDVISSLVKSRSKRKILWILVLISFFLSSVLDNLTTTIVMITLLRRLVDKSNERLIIGGSIVIAANAGGAWTPIGDVTTTMLWIGGQLSTLNVLKELFLPSLVCVGVSTSILSLFLRGDFGQQVLHISEKQEKPFQFLILFIGVGALIFVPIFKLFTGLPPFMGMLFGLSILWIVTDCIHRQYENRDHLRVPNIITKIDLSGVLFFMGILMCVDALYTQGLLTTLAKWLDNTVGNYSVIALVIGIASAIVDNVPLVAATMGMYGLDQFPMDDLFWNKIAYCAGTGGSILIIGSAAGVVFMGIEKVDFLWYSKRISIPAAAGYFAGYLTYQLMGVLT